MSGTPDPLIRRADAADAATCGRMLEAFNREFDEPTRGAGAFAERVAVLLAHGDTIVLLGGGDTGAPVGIALLRLRPSLYDEALEAYLAELWVEPPHRGHGLGRALLEAAMDAAREAGATYMDLGTSEDDVAARALYESAGFDNHEGKGSGPRALFYERDL